ncbi:MAG: glycosyltransferase family 4 protein [Polyangiaceae bacterium]|nr:glycosyltransferase family 4 protein [Polyangiaceae bacterium]
MAKTKLRIVHTVSSLEGGGMEHFVLRLVEAQRRHGHDASILALRGGPLDDLARQRALPATVLSGKKLERIARAALGFAAARPDIVHAHNPTSLHYAVIGKLLTRAPLVFTDHAQTRGIIRVPTRFEWRQTDVVVGCSQDTADKSGGVGIARRVTAIHNGIDIVPPRRARDEMRAELGLGAGEVVGIMPAAFHKVKGHDVLLRALASLDAASTQARVRVLVAGDGDLRDSIHGLAKELGLGAGGAAGSPGGAPGRGPTPERVTFLGFRKDVPDLLMAADFFVLPSRDEGLPLAVLEAMARSLPVVVTPVGGVPEVVKDGEHGFLVPVDDVGALAAAIAKVAGDAELRARLGEAGHRRVRDDFSFERMTRKYEDLYFSLL